MRIIGGHDYYDSAQAFGQDLELVFVRTQNDKAVGRHQRDCGLRPVEGKLSLLPNGSRLAYEDKVDNRHGVFYFRPTVLWFAGRRYASVRVDGQSRAKGAEYSKRHIWSAAELRLFLASVGSGLSECLWGTGIDDRSVDGWFSDSGTAAEKEWMIRERISIAVSDSPNYELNYSSWKEGRVWKIDTDGLKEMGFASVVPPWEAFQQLSMWIGGILAHPGRPIVSIESDVVRRDKHGFDGMSFKKAKSGKATS